MAIRVLSQTISFESSLSLFPPTIAVCKTTSNFLSLKKSLVISGSHKSKSSLQIDVISCDLKFSVILEATNPLPPVIKIFIFLPICKFTF